MAEVRVGLGALFLAPKRRFMVDAWRIRWEVLKIGKRLAGFGESCVVFVNVLQRDAIFAGVNRWLCDYKVDVCVFIWKRELVGGMMLSACECMWRTPARVTCTHICTRPYSDLSSPSRWPEEQTG